MKEATFSSHQTIVQGGFPDSLSSRVGDETSQGWGCRFLCQSLCRSLRTTLVKQLLVSQLQTLYQTLSETKKQYCRLQTRKIHGGQRTLGIVNGSIGRLDVEVSILQDTQSDGLVPTAWILEPHILQAPPRGLLQHRVQEQSTWRPTTS